MLRFEKFQDCVCMRRDVAIELTPASEPLPIARRMKSDFIACDEFGEPGDFAAVSGECIWRNGMAFSGRGFGEEIEKNGLPFPSATFGH